nr:hypothetical protein CFP56_03566 [Quercus suber]
MDSNFKWVAISNAEAKASAYQMLNPKFEENFVKGRDYDPDRERAEKRKLQKQVKHEAKGAAHGFVGIRGAILISLFYYC